MYTKAYCKDTTFEDTFKKVFAHQLNLARVKFIMLFVKSLCKVQTVCFQKLALAFDTQSKPNSSLRRIQRFMACQAIDSMTVARLVISLLPARPPYRLAIDRTDWKFGGTVHNVLALAIVYRGVAYPLMFSFKSSAGCSSTDERIGLMERYIGAFGKESIDCLLADREFVGGHWLGYLNSCGIRYHIRLRNNFWAVVPGKNRRVRAAWFFNDLKVNEKKHVRRIVYIHGELCYLSASKVKNKDGVPELQIIASFNRPDQARAVYKKRWQIESMFKAMKTGGFNMEDTHLSDSSRLATLFSLVSIAFAWVYRVGVYMNRLVPVKRKKHGRLAKSIFKYGLEHVARALFVNDTEALSIYLKFLSCT